MPDEVLKIILRFLVTFLGPLAAFFIGYGLGLSPMFVIHPSPEIELVDSRIDGFYSSHPEAPVTTFKDCLVIARRSIKRGEKISADAIQLRDVSDDSAEGLKISKVNGVVVGGTATKDLQRNDVFSAADVKLNTSSRKAEETPEKLSYAGHGFITPYFYFTLFIGLPGMLISAWGYAQLLGLSFKRGFTWGMMFLFVPGGSSLFAAIAWDETKKDVVRVIIGCALCGVLGTGCSISLSGRTTPLHNLMLARWHEKQPPPPGL